MSGFKFIEGIMGIFISILLWLPLSYVFDLATTALNSMVIGPNAAEVIAFNNVVAQIVYYCLFFVILAVVVYIIKARKGEEEDEPVAFIPAGYGGLQVIRARGSLGAPGRITFLIGILLLLATPNVSAFCNGDFGYRYPITNSNSNTQYVLVNDTAGVTLSGITNLVFCNQTANYFCFENASVYACYDDDTKVETFIDEGEGTDYGTPEEYLAGWYHLNDTADASSYGNTLINFGPVQTAGHIGGGYDFEKTNKESLNLTRPPLVAGDKSLTFMAWAKLESTSGQHTIFDQSNRDAAYGDGIVFVVLDGNLKILTSSAGVWAITVETSGAPISTSTWYHLAASTDASTATLYIDGVEVASDTMDNWDGALDAYIGCWYGHVFDNCYDGVLDEVRIYNRTLSADEIIAIYNNTHPDTYSVLGALESNSTTNITLSVSVSPDPLYNSTDATFSIVYNNTIGDAANITVNLSSDRPDTLTNAGNYTFVSVPANTTVYWTVAAGNWTKHNNITLTVNATSTSLENELNNISREIQNTPPTTPTGALYPVSVIIGDNLTANVSSTDDDEDTLTYWYLFGYQNNTNITSWLTTDNLTILQDYENETLRAWAMADDGENNGTASSFDMNVTHMAITWPVNGTTYIGKTFYFTFNFTTEAYQDCDENVSGTVYPLGFISTDQNHSRTVWYGNNTYEVICYSLVDSNITYSKNVSFSNIFANWSVSIYTENDWDIPLNITGANLSIFITCEGGSQYVYNFTGTTFYGVTPECDVQSITAKVDYPTDSYARERSLPDCLECDIRMYMVDALIYTVLQIPIYMSDYNYFDTRIEIYKLSGDNHYTIAQGYFDVERKYVTYLTKDNTYYIRLDQGSLGSEVRDIGYLYAASATAQYLSLSTIELRPDIQLISDNLLMSAEFDDPTLNQSTLRIQYRDLLNSTVSVRIRVMSDINNTPWYDNTFYGYDNLTVSITNVNTTRQSVHFTVYHNVLGNSPVDFTVGVGQFGALIDFGLDSSYVWLLRAAGFVIILFTAFIIVPEIRFYGLMVLMAEFAIWAYFQWFTFNPASNILFVAILVSGLVYEIKFKGVT